MHGLGILMLAAVGGYWVLERSVNQRGQIKQVGQVLGTVIIALSLVGMGCWVWCVATGKNCPMGGYGMMQKGGMCPISGKSGPSVK